MAKDEKEYLLVKMLLFEYFNPMEKGAVAKQREDGWYEFRRDGSYEGAVHPNKFEKLIKDETVELISELC